MSDEIIAPIQHVVVVLFENRSYDNVLGWLYGAGNQAPYDKAPAGQSDLNGLSASDSNIDPYTNEPYAVQNAAANTVGGSGQSFPATAMPIIDPGEPFGHMAQQYLGVSMDTETPYAGYSPAQSGLMSGFMENYNSVDGMTQNNIGDVMTYLTPAQLPVTAFLANRFAVCDQWYASVPSHTFVNRLFAFCAAPQIVSSDPSYSAVDDLDYAADPFTLLPDSSVISTDSVCSQLDTSGGSWKLYFHDYSIAALTIPYIANAAQQSASQNNVSTFDQSDWAGDTPTQLAGPAVSTFVDDVQNGTLPAFSFIEPRYAYNQTGAANDLPPSSNHPGPGNYGLFTHTEPTDPPIDTTGGELLLMQIYNLLRNSDYWGNTLLIVTYDEPGGVYDHVPPQLMTPPQTARLWDASNPLQPSSIAVPAAQSPSGDTAADNFGYTVSGGRVPAIIVSPHIAAGTTIRAANGTPFDHSSIVKTLFDLFALRYIPGSNVTSLTERDAHAPSLQPFIQFGEGNDAPAFSGVIVASPSQIILDGGRIIDPPSTILLASAGPCITLSATGTSITTWDDNGQNWLTVTPLTIGVPPDVTAWTVATDNSALGFFGSAYLTGNIAITGDGVTTNVPVSLYLD